MKKLFIILTFLGAWFWITYTLLQAAWWQTYLHSFFVFLLSIMVGMSLGATVAIFTLSFIDKMLDKLYTLLADTPFTVEG